MNENLLKYLEGSPDLKVLKLEFKPEVTEHRHGEYPLASDLVEVSDLESDFTNLLKSISENFPKLQFLRLNCQTVSSYWDRICQAFASEKNIKLEVSTVLKSAYFPEK